MCDSLGDHEWLYRGVPSRSPEVADVRFCQEIYPRCPGKVGEFERYCHSVNEMTDSGYTSWTTNREAAVELALFTRDEANLSCGITVFQVRVDSIEERRIFKMEEREDEYLIEGTVENVEFSEDAGDEKDD